MCTCVCIGLPHPSPRSAFLHKPANLPVLPPVRARVCVCVVVCVCALVLHTEASISLAIQV